VFSINIKIIVPVKAIAIFDRFMKPEDIEMFFAGGLIIQELPAGSLQL
jgi:hypothetical protein